MRSEPRHIGIRLPGAPATSIRSGSYYFTAHTLDLAGIGFAAEMRSDLSWCHLDKALHMIGTDRVHHEQSHAAPRIQPGDPPVRVASLPR